MENGSTDEQKEESYKNILPEYQKFHQLGPKDVKWGTPEQLGFHVQVQKQTSALGEQIAIQVPIFVDDTLEDRRNRMQLAYAIMQERMEDENKAIQRANDEALQKRVDTMDKLPLHEQRKIQKMIKSGKLKIAPKIDQ